MKRFLVPRSFQVGERVRLSAEESKHATRVMRLEVGSSILLTDGQGHEAEAVLVSTERDGTIVEVKSVRSAPERKYRLELLQGTLKGARMDWLVEKATELGVDAIRAVNTQYSVGGDRAERWARVAAAALKQSGNLKMPDLFEATSLPDALTLLSLSPVSRGFLLSPRASQGLAQAVLAGLPDAKGTVILAIGPEGGFSPEEEKLLEDKGFQPSLLSNQILRGETAGLVAAAVALHALEFSASAEL